MCVTSFKDDLPSPCYSCARCESYYETKVIENINEKLKQSTQGKLAILLRHLNCATSRHVCFRFRHSVSSFQNNKSVLWRHISLWHHMIGDLGSISPTFMNSFYTRRSQKRKKTVKSSCFVLLLGSVWVKAVCKHVDKIDPMSTLSLQAIG